MKQRTFLNLKSLKINKFLPYENGWRKKLLKISRSHRNQKSTNSNSRQRNLNKIFKPKVASARPSYSLPRKISTPRYKANRVKLFQGNKLIQNLKKSNKFNEKSRQSKKSGVRSNIRTRHGNDTSFDYCHNICNYTQDDIKNSSPNDNSLNISKESGIISLSTKNKHNK